MIKRPIFPIIYVRGYAGNQGEVEDTSATPYMGFNLGSTKYRQAYDKQGIKPWVFESPLVRLMKDYKYVDAYTRGLLTPDSPTPANSIWIFRYYDVTSDDLNKGKGQRKEIEFHAEKLGEFIAHVRKQVLKYEKAKASSFRCYLVAHSMGGLICRAYLQNPNIPDLNGKTGTSGEARGVDKLFTFATPHGGIEFRKGLGWVEGLRDFLDVNNSGNFGEDRMREFLDLKAKSGKKEPLNSLNGRFPAKRVFCMVGTDSRDYGAAGGLSRRSVGPSSDGLVQISNAFTLESPRAFVYRSHSGHYGIVNSEESYQNLTRFLFGDIQASLLVDIPKTIIPDYLKKKGKVTPTYYIETVVSIRNIPLEVHRRTMDSESAIFRSTKDLDTKVTHLHTIYLDKSKALRGKGISTLGFLVRMRIVPNYHVDKKWAFDDHFEGQAVFDDGIIFEVTPSAGGLTKVTYGFTSGDLDSRQPLKLEKVTGEDGKKVLEGRIPFVRPYVEGDLIVRASSWNDWK